MEFIFSINEIDIVAKQVWLHYKYKQVWLFFANMGCGKTTFINTLCKHLEIAETSSSPTFSIINEYKSNQVGIVYHLDLYRLKDEQEAIEAGVEDVLYSNQYCFVEWPEKALDIMPDNVCIIKIEIAENNKRKLIIE